MTTLAPTALGANVVVGKLTDRVQVATATITTGIKASSGARP
ncbi:hypothetical protein ABZ746_25515 [Streptomyces sp. NPDC020096]